MNSNGSGGPPGCVRRVADCAKSLAVAGAVLLGSIDGARGQWVEDPGRGWSALAVYHHDTQERFGTEGDSEALSAEGHAVTTSSFLTSALGLTRGVDLWAQVSFHRLRYDDAAGERSSTGLGDARLWVRAAPLKWLDSALPFAVRAGVKIPVGDFEDVGADEVPLGDGQRDWEVMAELGQSFWPFALYASGWVGYRWREDNAESEREFGNELFYYAQIGGQTGRVGYKLAVDGYNGAAASAEGAPSQGFERDLVQLVPSLLYDVGAGQVQAGVRFAMGGRNVTSGTSLVFQYFSKWELF